MKELLDRLRILKLMRNTMHPVDFKRQLIAIYRDFLNLNITQAHSDFYKTKLYTFGKPWTIGHNAFRLLEGENLELAGIVTHAESIKVGSTYFDCIDLPINNSLTFGQKDFVNTKYDPRPSRLFFSLISKERIDGEINLKILESLGISNEYEQEKMSNMIKIKWDLNCLQSNLSKSMIIPYQDTRKGSVIDLFDFNNLKYFSSILYKNQLELQKKISIFDLEVSVEDRIKFVKVMGGISDKIDHTVMFKDGYWDSHSVSNDYEWLSLLDLL